MNGAPLAPLTRQFVDALMAAGGPPVYTLSPADARAPNRPIREADIQHIGVVPDATSVASPLP